MSANKKVFLDILNQLTPTKGGEKEVSLDQIDKAPLPTFPTEIKITPTAISSSSSSAGAQGALAAPAVVVTLSDPNQITDRFSGQVMTSEYVSPKGVLKEQVVKAVKEAALIKRSIPFEIFNRNHLNACRGLVQVFYFIKLENLQTAINYAKKFVNEELLNYCVNVVARHRPDFVENDVQLPSHITTNPSTYVDVSKVDSILYARESNDTKITDPVEIDSYRDFTATDAEPEHFIAYFREDIGINLHHRHWHEVYPNLGTSGFINMDRRGELFVYMHSQILARYNFERLCNGLNPVEKFSNFKAAIKEAYYPKLDEASDVKVWSPRQPNSKLQDVNRDGLIYEVIDMERWLERIISSIDRGYAIKKLEDGTEVSVKLEEPTAIDYLGNTIDAVPDQSYNYNYYGDLHTVGHILIAYCHDPDKRFKEQAGVMGFLEAALRDPMFYRWHAFVDDVMQRYKSRLTPYTLEDRLFDKIVIESVGIDSNIGEKNVIRTFWQKDRVDVTDGLLSLDQAKLNKRPSKVYVKFQHLQHKDFTYKIKVNNKRTEAVTGVVRIFMAPVKDETRSTMPFNKLRRYMIELDKFTETLQPGEHEYVRKSTCSSVTVPFEQTFMTKTEAAKYTTGEKNADDLLSYCGCGWPHHLLIGRGRPTGFPCTLFVMITDYEKDKVQDSTIESCGNSSISYCGVQNKKYPDKRPMGFPFDRPIPDSGADLETFMTRSMETAEVGAETEPIPNMYQTQFMVKFVDEIYPGPTMPEVSTTAC